MKEIKSSQKTHQDTHPVTHQDNPQANQVTTPDGKPVVSLNDLKCIMPDICRVKTPTAKELRALKPILEQPLEDGGLWVYSNGFAIYKSGKRTSVLRVSRACSHTYEFVDGEKTVSLNNQPWATALAIYGEGRIEQNTREWDGRRQVSYDGFDDSDEDELEGEIVLTASDNVENEAVERLDGGKERMLGCLTVRQKQVVSLRYKGLTQQAIADKLSISKQTVNEYLQASAARIKKTFTNF